MWLFENMEGLRTALSEYAREYAREYANQKMRPTGVNAVAAFEHVGRAFVEIAVKEPNLFRFFNLNEKKSKSEENFGVIITNKDNAEMIKSISEYLGIPEENVSFI